MRNELIEALNALADTVEDVAAEVSLLASVEAFCEIIEESSSELLN